MNMSRGLKEGVKTEGIQPEVVLAYVVACGIFNDLKVPCIITSVRDGKHKSGSFHYRGYAIDVRLPSWYGAPASVDTGVVEALRKALGVEYDVVHETPGTPGATGGHVHIEYDPPIGKVVT